jgi:hypothetical protein
VSKPDQPNCCTTCDGLRELELTDGQKMPSLATLIERCRELHRPHCLARHGREHH